MAKDSEIMRANLNSQLPRFLETAVGEPDESVLQKCEVLLASTPDHLGALEASAKIYWRRGDWAKAIGLLDKAIALYPYEPGYFLLRADCLQGQARFSEAFNDLQRCLKTENREIAEQAYTRLEELGKWQVPLKQAVALKELVTDVSAAAYVRSSTRPS